MASSFAALESVICCFEVSHLLSHLIPVGALQLLWSQSFAALESVIDSFAALEPAVCCFGVSH